MLIAHARSSETKTANGKAGDQTQNEVSITEWYDAGWTSVFRPINQTLAESIARNMEKACMNDHIGYSQNDRLSLYWRVSETPYNDISAISVDCNCDCSSLVAVACILSGINISAGMTTSFEEEQLKASGCFDQLIESHYIKSSKYLKRGDILHKIGHTAVCTTSGSNAVSIPSKNNLSDCRFKSPDYAGWYVVKEIANMRLSPNLNGYITMVVPEEYKVLSYGYYDIDSRGVKWLCCNFYSSDHCYTGYMSEKVLIKK